MACLEAKARRGRMGAVKTSAAASGGVRRRGGDSFPVGRGRRWLQGERATRAACVWAERAAEGSRAAMSRPTGPRCLDVRVRVRSRLGRK